MPDIANQSILDLTRLCGYEKANLACAERDGICDMAYASLTRRGFGQTMRPDAWWVQPLLTFLGLSAFIVYSTWAAFQGAHYRWGNYLSPGFRLTCYYYRGAYYKSFWADPPSCTVSEPRKIYRGENSFPLIMQNIHRYFMYLALIFLVFLAHDVWKALWFADAATTNVSFGIGVGTIVLALNVVFLGGYTFGCHSLRHLVGGGIDQLSQAPLCQKTYRCVSCFNRRHMLWAWMSLFWVGFSDLYVRLCSMGVWHDLRLL